MHKRIIVLISVLALLSGLTGCGGGNGSKAKGTLSGYVKNSEGQPLPAATVVAGDASTATNNSGYYKLVNVPAGQQTVEASLTGYFNDGRGNRTVDVVADRETWVDSLVLTATTSGSVLLWHLQASSSQYDSPRQISLDGRVFNSALLCDLGWNPDGMATYAIGRNYNRFQSQVGVIDTEGDLEAQVVFTVLGDGAPLFESPKQQVGRAATVDVDVSSVLILQLRATYIQDTGRHRPKVAWGDPRLTPK